MCHGCRYVSFTTGDAIPLYSSYETKADFELADFYGGGVDEWNRAYSIVAAMDKATATACSNIYSPDRDVLLTFHRHPLKKPTNPVIVMREILNKGYMAVAAVANVQHPQEAVAQSPACPTNIRGDPHCTNNNNTAAAAASEGGPKLHNNQLPPQAVLQEHYPKVELFNCDRASGFSVQLY